MGVLHVFNKDITDDSFPIFLFSVVISPIIFNCSKVWLGRITRLDVLLKVGNEILLIKLLLCS